MEDKSRELQTEIDRLSAKLGVRTMPVGLLTKDGLNIFVAKDNTYHFTFYERGQLGFDKVGSLNDLLYWYCQSIITREASARVGDRKDRFRYEYDWFSELDAEWAKRNVRETADMFRRWKPQDIALLPDIGEPL
ncbi:immunity 63 family protein [Mycobacteroides abscessus subsp. abscessus]|nr:immunity 63 family protein [Mycobacteroides abscessus]MDM2173639.1 immunity 63 family protein [Mycobacteroides abscessus]MDM2177733.1 immunity 63 family protein [Mycobacteroides abscessus]MDM2207523.1 immunity 63 family protein [Mycobacteroides abscessus]MDM2212202.1 immunity 63 family protein [Mycobacteroides abscessus]MDM2215267.1 immunity 63 family protein [Mycobacteroides abscessus]